MRGVHSVSEKHITKVNVGDTVLPCKKFQIVNKLSSTPLSFSWRREKNIKQTNKSQVFLDDFVLFATDRRIISSSIVVMLELARHSPSSLLETGKSLELEQQSQFFCLFQELWELRERRQSWEQQNQSESVPTTKPLRAALRLNSSQRIELRTYWAQLSSELRSHNINNNKTIHWSKQNCLTTSDLVVEIEILMPDPW